MKVNDNTSYKIYSVSEYSVTVELSQEIGEVAFNKLNAFIYLINKNPFPGLKTIVPAYTTLTVFFDPVIVFKSAMVGRDCFDKVSIYINNLNEPSNTITTESGEVVIIPVCYGGIFGPDLEEVANHNKLTTDEVIHLHASGTYKVYMIGFTPGFPYLGGMDAQLATPRKAAPRKAIPAGAVGIAGLQTGVYPIETPGGWQIIGQSPLKLFDIHRVKPALLNAGDRVIFKPIGIDEFKEIAGPCI
ncbi:5-oxoprolinase subunit PxpB [Mucilaginibacter sp. KACC 22773]|uniref:5-oxoprolinase subunit PxpB n=1 Tax=Mucilaginibacter sp. KACC 22773 TaxID=3025671 RepID=UPI002365D27A|nr:5-oxoprolinase subunit PxpB [Mucilaginibacter sp. KACC 22773]WDF77192.1 5-oxoprolinase subunit PxpB [Mucilaginibacter sp. KACC 22773]